jgi:transposase-like protein
MHDPDTKVRVTSALLCGMAIAEVVRQFGIPRQTAMRWRDEAFAAAASGTPPGNSGQSGQPPNTSWIPLRGRDWQDNFQRYVDDSLYSLRVLTAHLARPEVLERTDYAAIVDAHGSLADRIARLAETIGRVETGLDRQPAGAGPAGELEPAAADTSGAAL